jgi:hypothetical protein
MVVNMRNAQEQYYRTGSQTVRDDAKRFERALYAALLERAVAIKPSDMNAAT